MDIGRKDLIWSAAAYFLKIGSSLLLLPIILKFLAVDEVAIWYIFSSITGFVLLFDFGFSPTIIRNVTYIYCGATDLKKEGIEEFHNNGNRTVDYGLLNAFIHTIRKIYLALSAGAALLLVTLGSYYFYSILKPENLHLDILIWITWIVFILSTITNLYYLHLTNLLIGRGLVKKAQKAIVWGNLLYIVLALIAAILNLGLLGIVCSNFLGNLINRHISYRSFFERETKCRLSDVGVRKFEGKQLFEKVFYNAKKMGVVTLGGFLINKAGFFLVTVFFPLTIVAQYGLTMQLLSIVSTLSVIYFNTYLPLLNSNYISKKFETLKSQLGISLVIMLISYIGAYSGLAIFGKFLLTAIGSNVELIGFDFIFVLFIASFLESQHSIMATVLTFENRIPFVMPAIISGLLIVLFALALLWFFDISLWAIILPQLIVQLAYNNWKWPSLVLDVMDTKYLSLVLLGARAMFKTISKRDL